MATDDEFEEDLLSIFGENLEEFANRKITELKQRNDPSYRMYTSGPNGILKEWIPNNVSGVKNFQKRFNLILRRLFTDQSRDANPKFLYHALHPQAVKRRQYVKGTKVKEEDWLDIEPECNNDPNPTPPPDDELPGPAPLDSSQFSISWTTLVTFVMSLDARLRKMEGADHAVVVGPLDSSVERPLLPGTVLALDNTVWKYFQDCESDVVGVVSAKAHHYIEEPGFHEFKKCVCGTVPARVLASDVPAFVESMNKDVTFLCVTKSTRRGYMELWTGQDQGCEVIGYIGSKTTFERGMPYYQEQEGFQMHIDMDTEKMILRRKRGLKARRSMPLQAKLGWCLILLASIMAVFCQCAYGNYATNLTFRGMPRATTFEITKDCPKAREYVGNILHLRRLVTKGAHTPEAFTTSISMAESAAMYLPPYVCTGTARNESEYVDYSRVHVDDIFNEHTRSEGFAWSYRLALYMSQKHFVMSLKNESLQKMLMNTKVDVVPRCYNPLVTYNTTAFELAISRMSALPEDEVAKNVELAVEYLDYHICHGLYTKLKSFADINMIEAVWKTVKDICTPLGVPEY